jgi:transcription antitermination protein NusB
MPARSKARKRALDILFEAEIRDVPVLDLLAERSAAGSPPVSAYAADLVRGVRQHAERIDGLLAAHSEGWALHRMPAVDRNILRIGAYELLWRPDIPDGVAISEAVALARDLSTDASPSFINGLLARLLELKPSLDTGTYDQAAASGGGAAPADDQAAPADDRAAPADDRAAPADDRAAPADDRAAPADDRAARSGREADST